MIEPKDRSCNGSDAVENIDRMRKAIDEVDEQLLALLNRRLHIVREIGRIKANADLPVVDNGRENTLLERLARINEGPLQPDALERLFREIIRICRDIQQMEGEASDGDKG